MLLLLLSRFSRVRLCATPQTAAHQAAPSLGFSRQEHWSGLPFPSPMHESEKWKWSRSVMSNPQWPHGLHAAFQALPSMGFSRQEYWSGVPLPSPCYIHIYLLIHEWISKQFSICIERVSPAVYKLKYLSWTYPTILGIPKISSNF